ncbi:MULTISPECIES: LacI family DNA-binding transcriptional regulator [Bacillales]|uniref:LacI family DNA-binding transcriptional regulator n=1 Tax=Lysinibacillus louembei TaxID=1470088 RepID=A0ABZ0S0C8_9BACI|nr:MULTISPECIES: LacI family DNA-binding transcriptional regulator [Bacillales]WPK13948.1 LacI family DNA-binding transcriptional regulator [Lysinibacillus louembei]
MVSSKDVAKLAGVSQTTVSRVLNTPDLVKASTVNKVLKAIEQLNYIPNEQARLLVTSRTNTIALLSGPLHNPFFSDTTAAIVKYANSKGYKVDVQFVQDEELEHAYSKILERKVDGIILSCILYEDPFFEKLKRLDIPFITFNRKHQSNENFVEIDNEQAGYIAAQTLQTVGHKHIAYVGGHLTVSTYANRFKGALRVLGETIPEEYIYHSNTTRTSISQGIDYLLQQPTVPTAIIGASDSIALNVIDELLKRNIRVPEDISVIGIDNVELAAYEQIQLTTVGHATEKNLGLIAITKLTEMIENKKNSCVRITESVKLFNRKTVK